MHRPPKEGGACPAPAKESFKRSSVMNRLRLTVMCLVAFVASLALSQAAFAQAGGGGGGGGGFGGGGFDPAQMRQRMMDALKQQLGATDDEWKAIQPKVEKVMEAQRDARSGGGMGMFFGGRGGGR